MNRFFSLFDISGKLESVYQTFQTNFNISHESEPVDYPWMTVSLKDPDASVLLLQGDSDKNHLSMVRSDGLPLHWQERCRTIKPKHGTTILKEQTSAANIVCCFTQRPRIYNSSSFK